MKDGFYKVKNKKDVNWRTIGELKTIDDIQYLFLIGFDEAMNPNDFIICRFPIPIN
ncbi:MAG: hypothetical protein M0P71_01150 [Melioribacteraceae bacterium]|nr:hypothetical protein [Melioribacteraceae bacterium]